MNKDYNKKKRITIIALSVLAVCLAGGLMWYMGTLDNTQPPTTQTETTPEQKPTVTVPEIKADGAVEPSAPATPPTTSTPVQTTPGPQGNSAAGTVTGDVQQKPSEGKPKTPDEATPPSAPPKDEAASSAPVQNPDASGQCQPENTPQPEPDQPQGGETRSDGAVYVPGFGWVEDSGEENETVIAPNAGTGESVGEM